MASYSNSVHGFSMYDRITLENNKTYSYHASMSKVTGEAVFDGVSVEVEKHGRSTVRATTFLRSVKKGSPIFNKVCQAVLDKEGFTTVAELLTDRLQKSEKQREEQALKAEAEKLEEECALTAMDPTNIRFFFRPFSFSSLSEEEKKEMETQGWLLRDRPLMPSAFHGSGARLLRKDRVKDFFEKMVPMLEEEIEKAEKRIANTQRNIARAKELLAMPGEPMDFEEFWAKVESAVKSRKQENENG